MPVIIRGHPANINGKPEATRRWLQDHGCIFPWFGIDIDPATETHFSPLSLTELCYVALRMQGGMAEFAAVYAAPDSPPHACRVHVARGCVTAAEQAFTADPGPRTGFSYLEAQAALGDVEAFWACREFDRRFRPTKKGGR